VDNEKLHHLYSLTNTRIVRLIKIEEDEMSRIFMKHGKDAWAQMGRKYYGNREGSCSLDAFGSRYGPSQWKAVVNTAMKLRPP
jgi:hypothetical protein